MPCRIVANTPGCASAPDRGDRGKARQQAASPARWEARFRLMAAKGVDLAGEARLLDAMIAQGSPVGQPRSKSPRARNRMKHGDPTEHARRDRERHACRPLDRVGTCASTACSASTFPRRRTRSHSSCIGWAAITARLPSRRQTPESRPRALHRGSIPAQVSPGMAGGLRPRCWLVDRGGQDHTEPGGPSEHLLEGIWGLLQGDLLGDGTHTGQCGETYGLLDLS